MDGPAMIVVVDCGTGNLQSVVRGLEKADGTATVSSSVDVVADAERLVLPGVGSFGHGMANLERSGLLPVLSQKVLEDKTPLLGICAGHQMLTSYSEEGDVHGLGWIDGTTTRLKSDPHDRSIRIPHMGWNQLHAVADCPLFRGISRDACFYFAHSYSVECHNDAYVVATTEYGRPFVSVVQDQNIFGVQFHPEKSHENGIAVLRNFVSYRQPSADQRQ